jgi:hypothetical protein
VKVTDRVLFLSEGKSTMQVPFPPPSPVVQVLELSPLTLQVPVTVAPLTGW